MNIYEMLLGDSTDQAQMAKIANRLRRQEVLGTVAALSGDPVMQPFGTAQMAQAQERAQGLRRARQQATTARALGGCSYEQGGQIKEIPGCREAAERGHQRALERTVAAAEAGNRAAVERFLRQEDYRRGFIPEATWRGPKGVATGLTQIESLASLVQPMQELEDVAQPGKDVIAGQLTDMGAGGLVRMVEPMYRSLDARQLRASLENILTKIRNSAFGAALTQYEGGRYEQVSPTAPGLTKEAMVERTKNLLNYLRNEAKDLVSGRRSPSGEPMPAFLEEGWSWQQQEKPKPTTSEPLQIKPGLQLPPGWSLEVEK